MHKIDAVTLLISDASGVYIPQRFVNECLEPLHGEITRNASQWAIDTCRSGPDVEGYWDAWDSILSHFEYRLNGESYTLHQDGDLWLLCMDRMTDEEKSNFGIDWE